MKSEKCTILMVRKDHKLKVDTYVESGESQMAVDWNIQ